MSQPTQKPEVICIIQITQIFIRGIRDVTEINLNSL